eukprot:13709423-Alexandrium_andersonii.AAC.1
MSGSSSSSSSSSKRKLRWMSAPPVPAFDDGPRAKRPKPLPAVDELDFSGLSSSSLKKVRALMQKRRAVGEAVSARSVSSQDTSKGGPNAVFQEAAFWEFGFQGAGMP